MIKIINLEEKLMKSVKNKIIKARCTESTYAAIQKAAAIHNTTTSNILLSAVEAYLISVESHQPKPISDYATEIKFNLMKNRISNTINLDSRIPNTTKEKIIKELMNIELC